MGLWVKGPSFNCWSWTAGRPVEHTKETSALLEWTQACRICSTTGMCKSWFLSRAPQTFIYTLFTWSISSFHDWFLSGFCVSFGLWTEDKFLTRSLTRGQKQFDKSVEGVCVCLPRSFEFFLPLLPRQMCSIVMRVRAHRLSGVFFPFVTPKFQRTNELKRHTFLSTFIYLN